MTINELKARRKELLSRKRAMESGEQQARDPMELFLLEEELLDVNSKIHTLSKGRYFGGRNLGTRKIEYTSDQQQFQRWQEDQSDEDDDQSPRAAMRAVLDKRKILLSARQLEIVDLLGAGMSQSQIALKLGVNRSTICRTLKRAQKSMDFAAMILSSGSVGEGGMTSAKPLDMGIPANAKILLALLTEQQVLTFYLYFGEHLSLRDISALLQNGHSTVSRTIHRCLKTLYRMLTVDGLLIQNEIALYEIAYQFFLDKYKDSEDISLETGCKPYWGREVLRLQFHKTPHAANRGLVNPYYLRMNSSDVRELLSSMQDE